VEVGFKRCEWKWVVKGVRDMSSLAPRPSSLPVFTRNCLQCTEGEERLRKFGHVQ